ncbi:MAG: hypothetical protein HQ581_28190 [Planctomycetes bacterium]|nr:hypothetical protein [Planctomycetota bacterium]
MIRKTAVAAGSVVWLLTTALLVYALFFRRDLFPLAVVLGISFGLLWVVGHVVASVIYRRRAGKFVLSPRFADPLFHERWISGGGEAKMWSRRVGASHCLWAAVLSDRFRVGAMFPFNLMFMPERLGLEYDILAEQITSVSQNQLRSGRVFVSVRFRDEAAEEKQVDLVVRDAQGFVAALRQMSETGSTGTPSQAP